jgi:hypothetical protein
MRLIPENRVGNKEQEISHYEAKNDQVPDMQKGNGLGWK